MTVIDSRTKSIITRKKGGPLNLPFTTKQLRQLQIDMRENYGKVSWNEYMRWVNGDKS